MTSEQPASEPNKKLLTGARAALAALTFSLLAIALSSSCNPTDSTHNGSRNDPPPAATPAAGSNPATAPPGTGAPPTQPARSTSPAPLPEAIANAAMTTLDGKPLRLSDLKGKVVILNLWATWCGPCRREIPDFIKIQEDYNGRGVEVLGITSEDERNTAEMVKEFVKEFEINYKVVWVDQETWGEFLAPRYSIPQTLVLDQNGQLLQKFVGYSPQVAVMAREIADRALSGATESGGRTDQTAK
ncbi:MAG TPA: TlpA disulfide reductase family protein [Pyrinomonadaceae bacterium]|jgi:cytochrome c biogenesis protein CcmG/thiol:disulfide interchange protein DsbE